MKILLFFLLSLPFAVNAQEVNGTITHAFNPNAAGAPDNGAKIYVFKYESDAISVYETISNFLAVKNYRAQNNDVGRLTTIYADSAKVMKGRRKYEAEYAVFQTKIAQLKTDMDERNVKLQALNAETDAKFEGLDQKTSKAISQAKLKANDLRTLANEAGNFSLKLAPGKYGILIISNNRTGFTSTEVYGKIFLSQLDIAEGEVKNVSAKFSPGN